MASHKETPFVVVNAFSDHVFGGNPALIVFVPQSSQLFNDASPSTLQQIAHSWNQPIAVFIALPSPDTDDGILNVRFFTPILEAPLCGHGLLAATKAIYDGHAPGLNANGVDELKFRNIHGTILSSRRFVDIAGATQGEWFELELKDNVVQEVSPDEKRRVEQIVAKALKKPDISVDFVGMTLSWYLLIVLNEKEKLAGLEVNTDALKENAPHVVNILTTSTPNSDTVFVSRMFAPLAGIPEDSVCGTAHTLLTPYWSVKTGQEDRDLRVKQVSPRGGDLIVKWEKERGIVKLRGQATVAGSGNLHL